MVNAMSEKTQATRKLNLVKIRSWHIPYDAMTYGLLKTLNIPLLKIHSDFMDTLEFHAKANGLTLDIKPFSTQLNSKLDELGTIWKSKDGRNCRMDDRRLTFIASPTEFNRKSIAKLETHLHAFFIRWAHKSIASFSESPTRIKLVVDYSFDPRKEPVIPSVDPTPKNDFQIILGFTKIKVTLFDKRIKESQAKGVWAPHTQVEIFTKAGNEWIIVHTATFTDNQIGDVGDMLQALGILFNRRKVNET